MNECLKNPPDVGGHQKVVEIDETEVGKAEKELWEDPATSKWMCGEFLTVLSGS